VAYKLKRLYTSVDLSQQYVDAARDRIGASDGLPVEGEGQGEWPEHADAELCWLYGENKVPYRQLCDRPKLLSLLTTKLNDRLGKTVHYTPNQVLERLGRLEQTAKLSAQLSDRVSSI
jgi:hypothetical protein